MLHIIAALNEYYALGRDNKLLWHIPEDLKRFKDITYGKSIIMGRKTFESLPCILPKRKHIVITRDKSYNILDERVEIVHHVEDVLKYKDSPIESFVSGGGEIYKQLLPYCNKLYLTKIHSHEKGDTYFPKFDKSNYHVIEFKEHCYGNIKYSFITYEKN
ncbi:dihydrofolate reductase [Clostridium coskatii]|uniref:Dihydrofolate reductase n=1 Tax=Clostridium coskatii TaxID=1705578 RepID=A0A166TMF2_9CLOT|nr:dihydrofolate reductase [Clostridium coskatii]OAA93869.1 Dihydrofolate reductase [Clostridium coskatii]OBR95197.1 dihydrofolate reductase [Clostridium coskatii]